MKQHKKIIAVDFDGTICENKHPDIGHPYAVTIERLKKEQREGARLILWTCRTGAELLAAIAACFSWGLKFDAVNENLAEHVEAFGGDTRKIYADEYWDDRAVPLPAEREKIEKRATSVFAAELLRRLDYMPVKKVTVVREEIVSLMLDISRRNEAKK